MHAKDLKLIRRTCRDEEVQFVERNYPIAQFKDIIPPDEWRYVAYGLARGGVFTATRNPSTPAATLNAEFPATGS
jgi:hypothetical protein